MPMGRQAPQSSFTPRAAFNSVEGIFNLKGRKQNMAGEWVRNDQDITANCAFAVDTNTMEVGWETFRPEGGAPVREMCQWAPGSDIPAHIPEDPPVPGQNGSKWTFHAFIRFPATEEHPDGEVRSFATASAGVQETIEAVLAAAKASSPDEWANENRVPVLKLASVSKVGRYYRPAWELVQWTDRGEGFGPAIEERAEAAKEAALTTNGQPEPAAAATASASGAGDGDLPF